MNLTDKARRGSQEAMEALFDMTKNDVAYLCRLLLGDNQASGVAVAPHLPQPVGAGARRAHHHRGGLRPGRPGENSGFLQNRPHQKGLQVLPHPPKIGISSWGWGRGGCPCKGSPGSWPWTICRRCTGSSMCCLCCAATPRRSWPNCSTPMRKRCAWPKWQKPFA